jgi:hypothetical protein
LTPESIIDILIAYGAAAPAHEAFDFLSHGEFPDGRMALVLTEAESEIRSLLSSPSDEDPNVSSREQTMTLLRHYTLGGPMRPRRDYTTCDRKRGLWKWKTRTVRIAGMYLQGPHRFVIAHVGFARGLKRGGKAVLEREAAFPRLAATRLETVGLLPHAWNTKDPHDGETPAFDPYQ